MKLNEHQARALQDACDDEDLRFRRDYSGRGMYGKECIGITADDLGSVLRVMETLHDAYSYEDEAVGAMYRALVDNSPRSDNMGLSTIFYWPSISVDEDAVL